jgi:MFS family permease
MGIYGFSAAKGFAYGLFFGTLVAILTYLIIVFFKRKVARTRDVTGGKMGAYCGLLNFVVISGGSAIFTFLFTPVLLSPGNVLVIFVIGGIVGISSFYLMMFKRPLGGFKNPEVELEALKLEHEEHRHTLQLITWTTAIYASSMVIQSAIAYWGKYFPEVPEPILVQLTLYAAFVAYILVGLFLGVIAQIYGRMEKIRIRIKELR